jgi:protein-S-isoprenylcysteine O-methyltransferase Ste14
MTNDANAQDASTPRPPDTVNIGGIVMTKRRILITRLIVLPILAGLVALIYYMRPRVGMLISGGIWIAFNVYWGMAAKNFKTAIKKSEANKSTWLHQLMMNLGLLLLFVPVPGLVRHFLPVRAMLTPIGLGVQLAFFGLAIWARIHLGTNWSSRVRVAEGHELVRSGPYRLVRHPIYTAMLGMCAGTTIVAGQYHALLGTLLVLAAYIRKTRLEENILRDEFGSVYDDYRRHSWALVPGIY